jgi:hypothetical protein
VNAVRNAVTLFDGDEDDFIRSVLDSDDWSVVAEAFDAVPQARWEYVELTSLARAVLAAELLSAHAGDASSDVPDNLIEWALERNDPPGGLIDQAVRTLHRTLEITGTTEDWKNDTARDELRGRAKSLLTLLDW